MIVFWLASGFIHNIWDDPLPTDATGDLDRRGVSYLVVPSGTDLTRSYVLNGALAERPSLMPEPGSGGAIYEDVPAGTAAYLDGELIGIVDDGRIEFVGAGEAAEFDAALVPPFPYQTVNVRIITS